MSLILALLVTLVAVLAQVSIMPGFSIFGAQPNLLLVLLVVWTAVRPQREALLLIPIAGFALGLLDGRPLGVTMLALAPLILMTEVRGLRLVESELLPAVGLVAIATLAYETIILLTLAVAGERLDWAASPRYILAPALVANVLLLLPVYGLAQLARIDYRPSRGDVGQPWRGRI